MRNLSVAICEDDADMLGLISSSISMIFSGRGIDVSLITARSTMQLRKYMEQQRFDLLFLDIQMPQESGIVFTRKLREQHDQTAVVYVSSQESEVFNALQTQPFGFVRKRNFLSDVEPLIDRFLKQHFDEEQGGRTVILSQKSGVFRVPVDDICYLEGSGKNQQLYYRDKSDPMVIHSTMDALEESLASYGFIRIHKGFLVNFRSIAAILPTEVELEDGQKLPLSRRRSQEIKLQYLDLLKQDEAVFL